jgi:hypothetical protein
MDELAAFKNAPRQLLKRENALLKVTDISFLPVDLVFSGQSKADIQTFIVSPAA